jgi:hypothetical protein
MKKGKAPKPQGKGATVGRKVGAAKSVKQMVQHDRKVKSKGSMGYGNKTASPAVSSNRAKSARAKRLGDVPL